MQRIHVVVIALAAFIALVHCGSATERDDATSRSSAALGCAAGWDPTWQQGSGANTWWVEYAITGGSVTATSAHLEVVGVGNVPLTFQWEKWVGPSSFQIPTGTSVVVHAESADGQTAQTQPFGYLSQAAPVTACGSSADAGSSGSDAGGTGSDAGACWNPSWQQTTDANNWWVEYTIGDATVTSAYLEVVGVRNVPLSLAWGDWVGSTGSTAIATGTQVIVHATNAAGRTTKTLPIRYLTDTRATTDCGGGTVCTPSCTGHTCGTDGCGGSCGTCAAGQTCTSGTCTGGGGGGTDAGACSSTTWQQTTDANNWWVEYAISDATVTSAYLEVVGVRNVPLSLEWGDWVGSTGSSAIATGTQVVVHATNAAGQSPHTMPFRYLTDTQPVTDCGGACVPSCAGRTCGSDGCTGSCGTCAAGQTCTSGACTGGSSDGGAPAVRFVGRADTTTDPAHPKFGWPGSQIIARFSGTTVTVSVDEESLYTGPSRWDVLIDGVLSSTLVPNAGTGTYTVASGLSNTVHTIELYKLTEGMVGQTRFMGFAFPNGGQLLAPPDPPSRRILFLGDSTTCGYGDLCTSPLDAFSGATETERLAFAGLVAHDLVADHQDISYSGKGVLLNYHRADTEVFDQLFPRALPMIATPTYDFSLFTPDVVWMNLGGNDWDQETPSTPPPDLAAYTQKYIDLATTVRSKFPNAIIVISVTPSLNDDYPVGWNVLTNQRTALTNVVAARSAAGDSKISMYEFARATNAQLTGCDYHTPLPLHRTMADQVITQIKARTGWN